jgi:small subunit ribosomal protein S9
MSESYYATGKRKTAIARVWLKPGKGKVELNREFTIDEYFGGGDDFTTMIEKPLVLTDTTGKFDIMATVKGGGKHAQAEAVRHGISRALLGVDPENRLNLKRAGMLTRDPRMKERKKYGQKGARARFQFSKR